MLDAEKKPESGARGSRESLATRIACPSFLSSQPLIYGLDHDERVHILPDSHGQTWEMLSDGRADVALLPAIDLQRCPERPASRPGRCSCVSIISNSQIVDSNSS